MNVIAASDYCFSEAEVYEVNKECSFHDAYLIFSNRDELRKKMFLLQERRFAKNVLVKEGTVMRAEKERNENTCWDLFFMESEDKNTLLCVYSWSKDYIRLFPQIENRKEFKNAYDLKEINLPVPYGVSVFNQGRVNIVDYKTLKCSVRVTQKGDEENLKTYYTNYLKHTFKNEVPIKKVNLTWTKNNGGFHSYSSDLYDMSVKIEFDLKKTTVESVAAADIITLINTQRMFEGIPYKTTVKNTTNHLIIFNQNEDNYIFQVSLDANRIITEIKGITEQTWISRDVFASIIGKKLA